MIMKNLRISTNKTSISMQEADIELAGINQIKLFNGISFCLSKYRWKSKYTSWRNNKTKDWEWPYTKRKQSYECNPERA